MYEQDPWLLEMQERQAVKKQEEARSGAVRGPQGWLWPRLIVSAHVRSTVGPGAFRNQRGGGHRCPGLPPEGHRQVDGTAREGAAGCAESKAYGRGCLLMDGGG